MGTTWIDIKAAVVQVLRNFISYYQQSDELFVVYFDNEPMATFVDGILELIKPQWFETLNFSCQKRRWGPMNWIIIEDLRFIVKRPQVCEPNCQNKPPSARNDLVHNQARWTWLDTYLHTFWTILCADLAEYSAASTGSRSLGLASRKPSYSWFLGAKMTWALDRLSAVIHTQGSYFARHSKWLNITIYQSTPRT